MRPDPCIINAVGIPPSPTLAVRIAPASMSARRSPARLPGRHRSRRSPRDAGSPGKGFIYQHLTLALRFGYPALNGLARNGAPWWIGSGQVFESKTTAGNSHRGQRGRKKGPQETGTRPEKSPGKRQIAAYRSPLNLFLPPPLSFLI